LREIEVLADEKTDAQDRSSIDHPEKWQETINGTHVRAKASGELD
jgi:hypothetical protein